jgi:hypothetical protein
MRWRQTGAAKGYVTGSAVGCCSNTLAARAEQSKRRGQNLHNQYTFLPVHSSASTHTHRRAVWVFMVIGGACTDAG